jgi:hypothetical protein
VADVDVVVVPGVVVEDAFATLTDASLVDEDGDDVAVALDIVVDPPVA